MLCQGARSKCRSPLAPTNPTKDTRTVTRMVRAHREQLARRRAWIARGAARFARVHGS